MQVVRVAEEDRVRRDGQAHRLRRGSQARCAQPGRASPRACHAIEHFGRRIEADHASLGADAARSRCGKHQPVPHPASSDRLAGTQVAAPRSRARGCGRCGGCGGRNAARARGNARPRAAEVGIDASGVAREAHARELPARIRRERSCGSVARMCDARRRARAAAQHVLVAHELAVVFADGARRAAGSRGRARSRCASTPTRRRTSAPSCAGRRRLAQRERMQRAALDEIAVARHARAAATSHSTSVGSRAPAQRANASASKKLTWQTGVLRSTGAMPCSVNVCHWPSRCSQ